MMTSANKFGRPMLAEWQLDPEHTYLNHGTVGAPPTRVLRAQQAIRDEIERHPARFLLRELAFATPAPWRSEPRIREAMRPIAAFIGARPEDVAFAPNVTTAMNAVLRSLPFKPGDEILIGDLAYGAMNLAAQYVARTSGAVVKTVDLPFPPRNSSGAVAAFRDALTPNTKLAIVDHVTAMSAIVMPVKEIAEACHARGVPVLVDGAHAPGSIDRNIGALGVDWYAANLHKWAHAPRSCGFLWARSDRQDGIHPPVISWGLDRGFREEFEWNGTLDPTGCLAAPVGIALFHEWGWPAVRNYMHELAWETGRLLTRRWKTQLDTPKDMIGAMITVPLPERAGSTDTDAANLRTALLLEDRIEVQLHAWKGRLWTRVSAQIYNEIADVERLADAVERRT